MNNLESHVQNSEISFPVEFCNGCLEISKVERDLPYVTLPLDGAPTKFLLDTGASITILDASYAQHPKFQTCEGPHIKIRAVNGTVIPTLGHVEMSLEINGEQFYYVFVVANLKQCIIGYDFMKQHKLIVSTNPPRLFTLTQIHQWVSSLSDTEINTVNLDNILQKDYVLHSGVKLNLGILNPEIERFLDIMQEKFPTLFEPTYNFQDSHGITFKIQLHKPYKCPYLYQVPYNYRSKVKEMVDDMLKNGIIRPSTSEYRAPVVVVPKPDGRIRLCVDYRALNSSTIPDNYTLPRIEAMKASIKGKIFSALDLKDGFYQIPVDEDTIPLTAMAVCDGTYEFLRMSQGLRNAPPVFQRFMAHLVRGLPNTQVYVDDVIIYSNTIAEHIKHLEAFFERAHSFGLTINFKKTDLLQPKITYLGFEFDVNGYRPKAAVFPKIRDFPTPRDKRGVQKFMGVVNYYRDHIPGLAEVAHPIYELNKKYKRFEWSAECQKSFDGVKELVAANLTLTPVEPYTPFDLYTDASNNAIGAALLQNNKVVNFFSKHLDPTQQRYTATMRETYAMVQSICTIAYT